MLPVFELKFKGQSLPCALQLAANNVHDRLQNLLLDLGRPALRGGAFALSAQEQIDEGIRHCEIQLQQDRNSHRHQFEGSQVSDLGDALEEFPIGQMLSRNQRRFELNAQIRAQGMSQVEREGLVQAIDRLHMFRPI